MLILRTLEIVSIRRNVPGLSDSLVFWWMWFFMVLSVGALCHLWRPNVAGSSGLKAYATLQVIVVWIACPLLAIFAVGYGKISLAAFIVLATLAPYPT